jgi:hypothetical protein
MSDLEGAHFNQILQLEAERDIWKAGFNKVEKERDRWKSIAMGAKGALMELADIANGPIVEGQYGCDGGCAIVAREALDAYPKEALKCGCPPNILAHCHDPKCPHPAHALAKPAREVK